MSARLPVKHDRPKQVLRPTKNQWFLRFERRLSPVPLHRWIALGYGTMAGPEALRAWSIVPYHPLALSGVTMASIMSSGVLLGLETWEKRRSIEAGVNGGPELVLTRRWRYSYFGADAQSILFYEVKKERTTLLSSLHEYRWRFDESLSEDMFQTQQKIETDVLFLFLCYISMIDCISIRPLSLTTSCGVIWTVWTRFIVIYMMSDFFLLFQVWKIIVQKTLVQFVNKQHF